MKLKIIEQESVDQLKTAGKFIKKHEAEIAVLGALGISGILTGCSIDTDPEKTKLKAEGTRVSAQATSYVEGVNAGKAQVAQPTAEIKANAAPATAIRAAVRPNVAPATAPAVAPAICADDGKLEYVVNAVKDNSRFIERQPIGLAAKTSIVEVGQLDGTGFAGWNRAILVVPTKGDVWQVNLKHVSTVAERSFCGKLPDVVNWAIAAHVPSLQQASRDAKGNQPSAEEIGVYRFDFERKALIVEKPSNVDLGIILGMIDVSFRQNGQNNNVPIHVETK